MTLTPEILICPSTGKKYIKLDSGDSIALEAVPMMVDLLQFYDKESKYWDMGEHIEFASQVKEAPAKAKEGE